MPWTRLDDQFIYSTKVHSVSVDARWLYIAGLVWSVGSMTDGVIAPHALAIFAGDYTPTRRSKSAVELVDAGLWEPNGDGWIIHDFTEYQPTKAELEQIRARGRRRQELWRDRDLRNAVKARDRGLCRYCGTKVKWTDRKSGIGGTYDHVEPDGPNTVDNLVVACRSCNSKKGARSPQEANMPLTNYASTADLPQINRGSISKSVTHPNPTQPLNTSSSSVQTMTLLQEWADQTGFTLTDEYAADYGHHFRQVVELAGGADPDGFIKWARAEGCYSPAGLPKFYPRWLQTRARPEVECQACSNRTWIYPDEGGAVPCPDCRASWKGNQ